jgi:hypothetical protein
VEHALSHWPATHASVDTQQSALVLQAPESLEHSQTLAASLHDPLTQSLPEAH